MPEETDRRAPGEPFGPAAGSLPPVQSEVERRGPLAIERHAKADGRLLILYRWVGEDG